MFTIHAKFTVDSRDGSCLHVNVSLRSCTMFMVAIGNCFLSTEVYVLVMIRCEVRSWHLFTGPAVATSSQVETWKLLDFDSSVRISVDSKGLSLLKTSYLIYFNI